MIRIDESTSSVWIMVGGVERQLRFTIGLMSKAQDALGRSVIEVLIVGMRKGWPEVSAEALEDCELTVKDAREAIRIALNLTAFGTPDQPEVERPLVTILPAE